jgi:hypothetical protein
MKYTAIQQLMHGSINIGSRERKLVGTTLDAAEAEATTFIRRGIFVRNEDVAIHDESGDQVSSVMLTGD